MGVCDIDPDIFNPPPSVATSSLNYINVKSCSDGGFGVCQQLWTINKPKTATSPPQVIASNVLGHIFRQSYGNFKYENGSYIPSLEGGIEQSPPTPELQPATSTPPGILSPRLYRLGSETATSTVSAGIYVLKFNTNVSPEQQPLRMIYIDWGDGSRQAFTGQDNRQDANNPHAFYHYYSTRQTPEITIRAWDNWDNSGAWRGEGQP
jgi:hypothetical protein